ncbi:hypothetical protein ACTWJ8_18100 [Streptomyces sp. SDT5-1]|uniref:hypothetical protein n=1 Tax=Streptomyces sp. SDT5-1 TaxID=3406418 RepID=UPI003FD14AFB
MTTPRNPGPDPGPTPQPPHTGPVPVMARLLVSDPTFMSCRSTVLDANPGMLADMAGRIVEEAIKFVAACAKNPGSGLAPSRIVDEGWHALLLHSAPYADMCARLGGFVHHYPGYDPTHHDPPRSARSGPCPTRNHPYSDDGGAT